MQRGISVCLLPVIVCSFNTYEQRNTERDDHIGELDTSFRNDDVSMLKVAVGALMTRLTEQETATQSIVKENEKLKREIETLRTEMVKNRKERQLDSEIGTFTGHGCSSGNVSLSCPSGRTINVTSAFYGYYDHNAADYDPYECAPPHPAVDCTEHVTVNNPDDWLAIKQICDGKTNCTFAQWASGIACPCDEYCDDDQYTQIFFNCLPEPAEIYPVAFTAYHAIGRSYWLGSVVMFGTVLTNIGGHYFPATACFICPFNGVYSFTVHFLRESGTNSHLDIMRNSELIARAYSDYNYVDGTWLYYANSNSVITECETGDYIWVEAAVDGGNPAHIKGDQERSYTFSGHIISHF